jgi:hypothetical protein
MVSADLVSQLGETWIMRHPVSVSARPFEKDAKHAMKRKAGRGKSFAAEWKGLEWCDLAPFGRAFQGSPVSLGTTLRAPPRGTLTHSGAAQFAALGGCPPLSTPSDLRTFSYDCAIFRIWA